VKKGGTKGPFYQSQARFYDELVILFQISNSTWSQPFQEQAQVPKFTEGIEAFPIPQKYNTDTDIPATEITHYCFKLEAQKLKVTRNPKRVNRTTSKLQVI